MPVSPIKTRDFRKIDWEAVRARMAVAKDADLSECNLSRTASDCADWLAWSGAQVELTNEVRDEETIVVPHRPVVERWVRERRSWSAADGNEANPPEAGR